MNKINKVIKFSDLPAEAFQKLLQKYPDGWRDHVRKITKPNGEYFYAINVDTDTVSYLVKVDIKVDTKSDVEKLEDSLIEKDHLKSSKEDDDDEEDDVADDSSANDPE
ncbi:MAG: hypothetical protein K9H49_01050 [Bacteroidales bacterium]|nr:hypothetical protein [Bacteroidales bacterium]MCF8403784.1 hypothetical protein [Bacteroidales bacterium]